MKPMALKFYYNGIKDNGGALQRCFYSHGTPGCITIYKRDYKDFSQGVREAFKVLDDTDIQSDYIVQEYIRVAPEHPLYAHVQAAWAKAQQLSINAKHGLGAA